ncbi:MAG: DoxX family membrane protein [Nanoarchaeota archaeon]
MRRDLLLVLFLLSILPFVAAHSVYVLDPQTVHDNMGRDDLYVTSALAQPITWICAVGILILILILRHAALSYKPFVSYMSRCVRQLEGYKDLTPWMLRLSLGIALIGGGVGGFFISPTLPFSYLSLLQTALGFVFLLGFGVRIASVLTLGLFLYGLSVYPELYGNLELIGATLALLLLGSGKPGLDDITQLHWWRHSARWLKAHQGYASFILRFFLGITFIFLAFHEKFLNPHLTEAVVNQYQLTRFVPVAPNIWVVGAGLVELTLGLLLLFGFYTRTTATLSFAFIGLTLFYFGESVTSHVTLFGILSVINVLGAGRYSLDHYLKKRHFVL